MAQTRLCKSASGWNLVISNLEFCVLGVAHQYLFLIWYRTKYNLIVYYTINREKSWDVYRIFIYLDLLRCFYWFRIYYIARFLSTTLYLVWCSTSGDICVVMVMHIRQVPFCFLSSPFCMTLFCTMLGKWAVMWLFAKGIDFVSFYDFSIEFWNCSDCVLFFVCTFCKILSFENLYYLNPESTWSDS